MTARRDRERVLNASPEPPSRPSGGESSAGAADTSAAGRVRAVEAASLAERVHSAAIHLLRRLRRTDPLTGVNPAQLSVLSVLLGGPRTIGDLAATEQVQPPTMSRLIREMEAAGLVFRTRDDADGRVVWIQWTDAGAGVLTRGRALRIATLRHQVDALPAAERQTLIAGLEVLERLVQGL